MNENKKVNKEGHFGVILVYGREKAGSDQEH